MWIIYELIIRDKVWDPTCNELNRDRTAFFFFLKTDRLLICGFVFEFCPQNPQFYLVFNFINSIFISPLIWLSHLLHPLSPLSLSLPIYLFIYYLLIIISMCRSSHYIPAFVSRFRQNPTTSISRCISSHSTHTQSTHT